MHATDIARLRLHAQQIARPRLESPAQVVARLGAMQAQDYLGALWAIGLRLPTATEAGIEQAITERSIVRTWPMRGTLHFVAAADVRWMLSLMASRVIAAAASRNRQLELDEETFACGRGLCIAALQGSKQLSRPAMYQVLEAGKISAAGQRGLHILGRLAQEGLLCFGAREGKQPTFALLDEWIPATRPVQRDEALGELARRYFTGHGPATVQDCMWWSGLPGADVRAGIDMMRQELVQETIAGQAYWMSGEATAAPPNDMPEACLLPPFDEYLLGYRDRSAVLDAEHSQKVNPGSNGMFGALVVIDGRVAGTWKRTLKRGGVSISYSPFASFSDGQQAAIDAESERYDRFLFGAAAAEPGDGGRRFVAADAAPQGNTR